MSAKDHSVTFRRLRDGATAMGLAMPTTLSELKAARDTIRDGLCALQSLDDLGSEEENQRAWDDMF